MNKIPNKKYKDESYFKPKNCPKCKSKKLIKWGFRYNCTTKKRRYKCKKCGNVFVVDDGFFKCKKKREVITECLNLYMNGMSLRKVSKHINQFSEHKVSHMIVLKWIRKYAEKVSVFTDKLPIIVGGKYHADEIFVKCKGRINYFWNLIDAETRFLVSEHYSENRDRKSAKVLFLRAKERAKKPYEIYTDGLHAYEKLPRKLWFKNTDKRSDWVKHIRTYKSDDYRNNIIERIEGTIRERVKVMRGFKSPKSAEKILKLFVIWYNFIRVHQGIHCTPAQRAGVKLDLGKNKWLNLIYGSSIK